MENVETPPPSGSGLPFAILRHDLPDGSFHFDWLFARENPPTTVLRTFRTLEYPGTAAVGMSLKLERIADHRLIYLTYEGALSRNRGTVRRLASGHYHFGGDLRRRIRMRLTFSARGEIALVQIWDFDLPSGAATLQGVEVD